MDNFQFVANRGFADRERSSFCENWGLEEINVKQTYNGSVSRESTAVKTIYISSTFEDLKEHRAAVYHALQTMQYRVIAMEDYVAKDERTVSRCLADVAICDFYVGIIAKRYGYVPPVSDNPDSVSITELEYRKAREAGKCCLLFLVDPKAEWPESAAEHDGHKVVLLQKLRAELEPQSPGFFRASADLAQSVMASVHVAESEVLLGALPADLRSDVASPEPDHDLKASPPPLSPLYLGTSYLREITSKIRAAIHNAGWTRVIGVNLGIGQSWWSTRLHLLAALLADYTDVAQIAFTVEHGGYLGMCSPGDVRRALAATFPEVEIAYRDSLPIPAGPVFDSSLEIDAIVEKFAKAMDNRGGEVNVKQWVPPHVLSNWRGFDSDKIELTVSNSKLELLRDIVSRRSPFVALVNNGNLTYVINRTDLATRVAQSTLR